MKIVYISKSIIPSRSANSIHVMKMCQALARLGHEVILLAPRSERTEPDVADPFPFYGVEPCFELRYASVRRGYGWWTAVTAKREKADLVYGRYLNGCFYATLLQLPVIFESHKPIPARKRVDTWLFERLIRRPTLRYLVVISRALADHYQRVYKLPANKLIVAHDAADETAVTAQPLHFEPDTQLHVGYIGHLYPGKGMEIIAPLAQKCPWATFHIIGGRQQDIAYWQAQTASAVNLIFHGFVSPHDTARYRSGLDVLLAPYQEEVLVGDGAENIAQWMSPLKLFEYMAAGKAIVASDLPVIQEVLTHRKNALLCPPADAAAWQTALALLKDDAALRQQLGQASRRDFAAEYTWQARAKRILDQTQPRVVMTFQYLAGIGGAQLQAFRLASLLQQQGYRVTILGTAVTTDFHTHLAQHGLDTSLDVRVMRPLSLPQKWPQLLRGYLKFSHYTLRALLWLYKNRHSYDIVHGHMLKQTGLVCGLAARWLKKPSLVKLASGGELGDVRKVQQSPLWPLRRRVHNAIGSFVCLTQEVYAEARHGLRMDPERLQMIPNGVDTERFTLATSAGRAQARIALGIDPHKRVVLYLGRLAEKKRVDFLLEAWSILQEQREDTPCLMLVGGGSPEALQMLARQLGVADSVQFCGETSNVLPWLYAADLFVLPSLSEGLANVLLEAMAAGLPCVATATPGNEDLIEPGVNGLLFNRDSREDLARCMQTVLADETLADRLGQAARATVAQKFSLQGVAQQYVDLYRQLWP